MLSDRLQTFMYSQLDPDDFNFRILTGSVKEAVAGTVCSMGSNPAIQPPSATFSPAYTVPSTTPELKIRLAGNPGTGSGQATKVSSGGVVFMSFAFLVRYLF